MITAPAPSFLYPFRDCSKRCRWLVKEEVEKESQTIFIFFSQSMQLWICSKTSSQRNRKEGREEGKKENLESLERVKMDERRRRKKILVAQRKRKKEKEREKQVVCCVTVAEPESDWKESNREMWEREPVNEKPDLRLSLPFLAVYERSKQRKRKHIHIKWEVWATTFSICFSLSLSLSLSRKLGLAQKLPNNLLPHIPHLLSLSPFAINFLWKLSLHSRNISLAAPLSLHRMKSHSLHSLSNCSHHFVHISFRLSSHSRELAAWTTKTLVYATMRSMDTVRQPLTPSVPRPWCLQVENQEADRDRHDRPSTPGIANTQERTEETGIKRGCCSRDLRPELPSLDFLTCVPHLERKRETLPKETQRKCAANGKGEKLFASQTRK